MFRRLFLGALLLLPSLFSVQIQGQVDPISRPRRTQTVPTPAEKSERPAPSLNAEAEAKRLYKVGVKYGNAGLYQQAVETLEQVVKLKPDYGEAYLSLGHAYYDLRQWDQAIENIAFGLALKPGDKASRSRLAQARRMLEQQTAGRDEMKAGSNGDTARPTGSLTSLRNVERSGAASSQPPDDALTKIYRVGSGDVLDIRLTDGVSSESTLFTVTAAGLLEHPGLKTPISVAGLSVEEIAARIEEDLSRQGTIKNPKVSVAVHEYISHTILVSGLVKEPGTKSLKREGIPLYVVIADAQPLPAAGRVSVQRNTSNESLIIDLTETAALNMLVRPGDVVNLVERPAQFFYVSGQVKSPGEKTFRRGLTLTQAIIAAGGLNKDAREAQVARDNGRGFLVVKRYKLKEIDAGKVADPAIQPGDRITVSE
jgi:protein involved in polysaccharide export with SLBB domain